jgi:hypothetical protein
MLMNPTRRKVSLAWFGLCVSSWIGASMVLASSNANAAACLPSAEAVKQQDPAAWPSWTLRAPGFEGTKCWYATTRGTAHDHRTVPSRETASAAINARPEREPVPAAIGKPAKREPVSAVISERPQPEPEPVSAAISKPPEPEVTGSAPKLERVATSMAYLDSTFEDRFLAVCPLAGPSIPGCTSPAPPMKRTGKLNAK